MTVFLADLSNNNGFLAGTAAIADPKVDAVYLKGTEGLAYKDALYPTFRVAAAKAHKAAGAYTFLHPELSGVTQAGFLLAYAKPVPGDLQPVVDSETLHNGDWAQTAATTLGCLQELERRGFTPILYASSSFLGQLVHRQPGLKAFRCWYADYATRLWSVPGVRGALWQFTDRMAVGKGRFNVDGDRLLARNLNLLRIPFPQKNVNPVPDNSPQANPRRSLRAWLLIQRARGATWKALKQTVQWQRWRRLGGR